MFSIIVDGETVETVMYDDENAIRQYIRDEYEYYGEKAKFERIGE
jgi:argonaute-like protein implicated in RNA metabolism and viral defense